MTKLRGSSTGDNSSHGSISARSINSSSTISSSNNTNNNDHKNKTLSRSSRIKNKLGNKLMNKKVKFVNKHGGNKSSGTTNSIKTIEIQQHSSFDNVSMIDESGGDTSCVQNEIVSRDNIDRRKRKSSSSSGSNTSKEGNISLNSSGSSRSINAISADHFADLDKPSSPGKGGEDSLNSSNSSGYKNFLSMVHENKSSDVNTAVKDGLIGDVGGDKDTDEVIKEEPIIDKGQSKSNNDADIGTEQSESLTPQPKYEPTMNTKSPEEFTPTPTTISGEDCLGQFSTVSGPSPVRLGSNGRKDVNLDVSMSTTIDHHDDDDDDDDIDSEEDGVCTPDNFQQFISCKDNIESSVSEKNEKGVEAKKSPPLLFRPDILTKQQPPNSTPRESTPSSQLTNQPATISGTDCMSQFSSMKSPSPMKMDHFNFDVSMDETSIDVNDSVLDENTSSFNDEVINDPCEIDNRSSTKDQKERSPRQSYDNVNVKQSKLNHPSTTRSSRRNQTNNIDTPSSSALLQHEYNVDHSCSTPLERLARDIGNTLREWHVHQGCDFHAPLDWGARMEDLEDLLNEEEPEASIDNDVEEIEHESSEEEDEDDISVLDMLSPTNSDGPERMSFDLCERGFTNRSRRIKYSWTEEEDENGQIPNGIDLDKSTPQSPPTLSTTPKSRLPPTPTLEPPPTTVEKVDRESGHRGARCIRSQKIQFQTTGYKVADSPNSDVDESIAWNRRRYNIPLILKLWDAPQFPSVDGSKSDVNDDRIDNIPKSLQQSISPSSYSLLGELGILSSSGTERSFYDSKSPSGSSNNNNNNSGGGNDIGSLNTGLTQDISTLFNIGQHITLCLDLTPSTNTNDIQSLYDDIRFYIENHINEAIEAQHRAIEERRHRERRLQKMARKRQMKSASQQHYEQSQEQFGCDDEEEVSFHENGKTDPVVPVGSQSMSLDVGEDEEVDFDNDIQNNSEEGSEYISSESNSSDDIDNESYEEETLDNDLYLNQQEIHAEVTASLTNILQTALNLAVSENKTSLPVFGIWGDYSGDLTKERRNTSDVSSINWIPPGLERDLLQIGDSFSSKHGELDDENMSKILLSSPALSGVCQSESFRSSHWLYSIAKQSLPLHLSTLNGLANVLVAQHKPNESDSVVLTAARHCYHWKQQSRSVNQDWRRPSTDKVDIESAVDVYRDTCQQQALVILERASSPSIYKRVPIWGPDGSPLVSITSSVSWGVISSLQDDTVDSSPLPPLLQLPLKIRSSNFESTPSELLEMEYALQSAALDPLGMGVVDEQGGRHEFGPREPIFLASAKFDSDAPCATLSANTRCVLAALLRCGSLGLDTLPGHLTKIVDFSRYAEDDDEGLIDKENSVRQAMKSAGVGPVTKRLVDALDWRNIETDLSNADFDRALTEALMRIQAYPAPPAEVFSGTEMSKTSDKRQSLCKGSPPGRLLSILFAHMARLRTPPSMMRLWLSFVEELRTRWDHNESLPNLGFVPGLDNKGDEHGQPHWGLQRADTRVLGHRADHAAFVNSSEPDPDRDQCIINQKLQVYNICIECKMSTEALHARQQKDTNNDSSDLHEESMESWGNSGEGQSMLPENNTDSDDDDFFDAEEEVSFDESPDNNQQESNTNTNIERMLKLQASVLNPGHNRVGARCPVPDALPLIESGDQLYAPYLQRTMPMTDEEEQKQKQFLGVSSKERPSIKSRIAIAQRLQKPKLLSDMAAFKSANHGAVFEDFVQWYGNPENPLQEEVNGETARKAIEYRSKLPSDEAKTLALEEASEAIAILMSLRAFWEDSWEEALEMPALNQEPLFDPYTTVEMVLHSFETIHPALLMNQVLAVKLTNAKFVLESDAKPAMKVESIAQAMKRLSTSINLALEMLTSDAANLSLSRKNMSDDKDPLVYVSTSTITSCEEACNVIGEVEILLSRALSLLQILPHQYTLVDILLQCKDEQFLFLKHPRERNAFLNGIKEQQNFGSSEARPAMREYVLNNTDRLNPCQLSARLVSSTEEENQSSLLLAITKSQHT